jgi:hypothetical protein
VRGIFEELCFLKRRKMINEHSKEKLLADIEKLISYGREEPTINPTLLAYLTIDDLISTKKKLLERVGKLSEEDKEWLEQFKKYE